MRRTPSGRQPTGGGLVVAEQPARLGVKPLGLMKGAQTDFYMSKAYSPALIAGRSYGKTIALTAKAYTYAQENPNGRGGITQPSFDMIRRNFLPVWDRFFGAVPGSKPNWQYRLVQQGVPSEIAFSNGFVYDLRPATNEMADRFRGATYCVALMDELRNEDQLACYLALTGAVRMPGYPLQFCVTSTPEARRPWLKKIWTDHVDPISGDPLPPEDYPKFTARLEENYEISGEQKKRIRAMYGGNSRYARQELDAEDVAQEGAAFEEFTTDYIAAPPGGTLFKKTVAGLDFGGTSPTALYELREDEHGNIWVTHEFYQRNATSYDWVKAAGEWGITHIICDPSGSDKELSEMRRKYGVRIDRASPRARPFQGRLDLLRDRLVRRVDNNRPRFFISPSCPNAINEIQNLAYAVPRAGELAVDRWEQGSLDHAYDAICYGLSAFDRYMGPPPRIPVFTRGWEN